MIKLFLRLCIIKGLSNWLFSNSSGEVWAGNLLRNLFLYRTVDSVNYNLKVFLEIIIFDSWYRNDFRVVYM